jgi:precorrin-3B methylase
LLRHRPPRTPVFIARNLGRAGEETRIIPLSDLAAAGPDIDMLSLVLVGSSTTRIVDGDPPHLYTPRGYFPSAGRVPA